MEKEEIKVMKDMIELLNNASFKNVKAVQMLEMTTTMKLFAKIIAKYEKRLAETMNVIEDKNKIIKEDNVQPNE